MSGLHPSAGEFVRTSAGAALRRGKMLVDIEYVHSSCFVYRIAYIVEVRRFFYAIRMTHDELTDQVFVNRLQAFHVVSSVTVFNNVLSVAPRRFCCKFRLAE